VHRVDGGVAFSLSDGTEVTVAGVNNLTARNFTFG
jgi:hypothetical protein